MLKVFGKTRGSFDQNQLSQMTSKKRGFADVKEHQNSQEVAETVKTIEPEAEVRGARASKTRFLVVFLESH